MHPPDELGRLITSHHPIKPVLAAVLCLTPGMLLGAGLWRGATDSALVGGLVFVVTSVLLIGLFAESLFLRQQLFENGLLLSSLVPGTPRYAIPYATIEPESITAGPYHRPSGAADITDGFSRRYRQAPSVAVVSFTAIAPSIAARLARHREDWGTTVDVAGAVPSQVRARAYDFECWHVSFRANDAVARTIGDRVLGAHEGPTPDGRG